MSRIRDRKISRSAALVDRSAETPVAQAEWPIPRAAYLHVPFCRHHCGYCNFTVIAGHDDLIERYLAALARELSALGSPQEVDTLFLGGGTPTHLPPPQLERLLGLAQEWFPLAAGAEFSVEANPGDLDHERAEILAAHGVTRVSLGAQSFDAAKLATLERDHTAESIAAAVENARGHGFSVSLDLIFAAPGETQAGWAPDVAAAIELVPDHISTYGLTIERGTTFWGRAQRGELQALGDETEAAMYELAIDQLAAAGFEHYEVSNFAQPAHRCRHNEVYWAGESYFAAGPGASRYVDGRRETNHRSTTAWLQLVEAGRSAVAESECLAAEDRAREGLVLGLRRRAGVHRSDFAARFGFAVDELAGEHLRSFIDRGLVEDDGERLWLSRRGLLVSDSIWPYLLRT
jgi:oxygen-independent coproporphyrinogen-3 oxidase